MTPWSSHPHPSKCHRGCQGLRAGRAVRAGVGPAALGGSWPCRGSSPAVPVARTRQPWSCNHPQPPEMCNLLLNIHTSYWQTSAPSVLLSGEGASFGQPAQTEGALSALALCSGVALSSQGWARPTLVFAQLCLWDSAGWMYRELKAKRLLFYSLTHVNIA